MKGRHDYAENARVTLRNIRRIEDAGFGWQVNFTRRRVVHWQYFADGRNGPADSLRLAIAWRDAMLRQIGPVGPDRPRVTARCKTGVVGVSRETYKTTSDGTAERYRAEWPRPGRPPARVSFSIDKYGEQEAKRRAVAARRRGVEDLEKARRAQLLDELHRRARVVGPPAGETAGVRPRHVRGRQGRV